MRSNVRRRFAAILVVAAVGLLSTGCVDAIKLGISVGVRQGVGAVTNTLVIGITDILATSIAQLGSAPQE